MQIPNFPILKLDLDRCDGKLRSNFIFLTPWGTWWNYGCFCPFPTPLPWIASHWVAHHISNPMRCDMRWLWVLQWGKWVFLVISTATTAAATASDLILLSRWPSRTLSEMVATSVRVGWGAFPPISATASDCILLVTHHRSDRVGCNQRNCRHQWGKWMLLSTYATTATAASDHVLLGHSSHCNPVSLSRKWLVSYYSYIGREQDFLFGLRRAKCLPLPVKEMIGGVFALLFCHTTFSSCTPALSVCL